MDAMGPCRRCREEQMKWFCCRGGLRRRRNRVRRRSGGGVDHISTLPDDLLLQILARLPCARAAACTSLLSRRWRGLWTRAPFLKFHNIAPDRLHAALARLARPAGLLGIWIPEHHKLPPARISALLRAAAQLQPAELSVSFDTDSSVSGDAVELPLLESTTSLDLCSSASFALPPAGDFAALKSLYLRVSRVDIGSLLPRFPSLRRLKICNYKFDTITVHSPLLEELDVRAVSPVWRIDIAAPVLKKLHFQITDVTSDGFSLSLSAPLLEDLSWYSWCRSASIRFGVVSYIWHAILKTMEHRGQMQLIRDNGNSSLQPQHCPPRDKILVVKCVTTGGSSSANTPWSFGQEISKIPGRNFSILQLDISTEGHVYGAMMLHILGYCANIQKLVLTLGQDLVDKACSVNCPCDQPSNWRSQVISLTVLKEVEINGLNGEEHEVGLLKALLRCAATLESVTLKLSRNAPRSCSAYMELPSILKAHPSVKFNIYRWCGDQVFFR